MSEKTDATNSDNEWVSDLIEKARKSNPLVPETVFPRMELLLNGQISTGKLTPGNLKAVAIQLLGAMVPEQPNQQETQ